MTASPAPNLRPAADGDFAAIAAITNHYIRATAIHFGFEDVAADELRTMWREHHDTYPWLVAEHGGAVVGYAKAGSFRARAAYRWITETGIYLDTAWCGRGIGGPLYRRLLDVLRRQGFHAAVGGIALPNDASVKLHERLGFVHAGTIPRAGRKFDRWYDVGFWFLALQPEEHVPADLLPPATVFGA